MNLKKQESNTIIFMNKIKSIKHEDGRDCIYATYGECEVIFYLNDSKRKRLGSINVGDYIYRDADNYGEITVCKNADLFTRFKPL